MILKMKSSQNMSTTKSSFISGAFTYGSIPNISNSSQLKNYSPYAANALARMMPPTVASGPRPAASSRIAPTPMMNFGSIKSGDIFKPDNTLRQPTISMNASEMSSQQQNS
jgi:hypothetical protein